MITHEGRFQLDGIRIDTYLLHVWLSSWNGINGITLKPSDITEIMLRLAVSDNPEMLRYDLPTLQEQFDI